MKKLKRYVACIVVLMTITSAIANAQDAEQLVQQVRAKLEKVNDYEASGKMKTNVSFIKVPVANVKVFFKKPGKLKIKNEKGISFIPKGSVNVNLGNVFATNGKFEIIDAGSEPKTGYRIIKMLPQDETADIVLSTLYIDEKTALVRKARTTTKENGTYELDLSYGKYAEYGLADKVVFSFNTKDYKLPKGVTFDYDDGVKEDPKDKTKNKKGKVEIVYSSYSINKGIPDSVFL